jgi:hypothetical protein
MGELYTKKIAGGTRRVIQIVGVEEAEADGTPISYSTDTVFDSAKPERVRAEKRVIKAKRLNAKNSEWDVIRHNPDSKVETTIALWDARLAGYEGRPGGWAAFIEKQDDRSPENHAVLWDAWFSGYEQRPTPVN